jgi:hypothetical protein
MTWGGGRDPRLVEGKRLDFFPFLFLRRRVESRDLWAQLNGEPLNKFKKKETKEKYNFE